ncbi:universal stress protein [Kutzneria viridogrisea]|uniref:UspA domain-containing protein n=2 Tax=Kutzneria TaxID=43356 RepID=W5WCF0_9PSEU|nr:universal stress protein [Kutzneria albida]AHH95889.1 hypothetical protein KALB_2521 [Kutzneria albida DSM 43870]MBA8928911.1 nucleotide-binding universal stress UspA family protein [Kutzneria viridogrisea]
MISKPIVVGHDGSESAARATGWAAREATRRGTDLVVVRACPPPQADVPHLVPLPKSFDQALVAQCRAELKAAGEAVTGVEVTTVFTRLTPVRTLVEQSATAQLLVLGSRGTGGVTGMVVGSTAMALAAHGRCPVAVVRSGTPTDGPVVLGVHESTSEEAIEFAFDAARSRDVPLLAVHTWRNRVVVIGTDTDAMVAAGRELLGRRLNGWQDKYPQVAVQRLLVNDRPGHALVEQSKHARLLVVGSRGRNTLTGALLGSTCHALVHHAECPVVIARNFG